VRRLHPSWTVRGGTELDYETTHVAVVAYTDPVAAALQRSVNGTCNVRAAVRKGSFASDAVRCAALRCRAVPHVDAFTPDARCDELRCRTVLRGTAFAVGERPITADTRALSHFTMM